MGFSRNLDSMHNCKRGCIYFNNMLSFQCVRLFAGERLGKNPYACKDKARHHGFTPVNVADVSDDEDMKAISTSYLNWSKDEDDCLLAYVDRTRCTSVVTKYFLYHITPHTSQVTHESLATRDAPYITRQSCFPSAMSKRWDSRSGLQVQFLNLTFQPPTQSHSLPCSLSFSFRFDGHPHGVCVQKAVSAPACRGS